MVVHEPTTILAVEAVRACGESIAGKPMEGPLDGSQEPRAAGFIGSG
jgi:hypothetical protein